MSAAMDSARTETQPRRALAEALRLAAAGYALTPVTITRDQLSGKKVAKFHGNGLQGKAHKGWRHESAWSSDPEQIRAWWVDYPDTSFAIGGGVNGVEGTDLDVKPAEGIDGVTWWGERDLPTSLFMQYTPSGGVHQIWKARTDGPTLPQEAGKSFGKGVDTRNRAGLFFAAGSYVVGEPGHYEIAGSLPRLSDLAFTPHQVLELFANAAEAERSDRPSDGSIVFHDIEWQSGKVQAALDAIRDHDRNEGDYRRKIQHLGLMYGRIVEQDFTTAEKAEKHWRDVHKGVWGPEVWPENIKTFRDALTDGPRLERWRVGPELPERGTPTERPRLHNASPFDPAMDGVDAEPSVVEQIAPLANAEEIEARALARLVADRKRSIVVDELARAELAAERAGERPSILDGLIDFNDLGDLPDPVMLLGEFIPAAGVGVLAGKFGSYKSFVTVSWACSLAAGKNWLERAEFAVPEPVKVLYVAAEGASGMKLRAKAWTSRFGGVARDNLKFFPRAVNLTDKAAVDDLEKTIAVKGFKVVFIDTLHRSAPGAEENSSTELGLVFEAACRLRDDHGVTVIFVDHTGHGGERPRGSSIKVDDSDFVIIADRPGEAATSDIQRTLKMHKRKDMDTDGEWPIRLALVEGTGSGYVELGSVNAAGDDSSPFGVTEDWHSLATEQVPEPVALALTNAAAPSKGKGKKAALDIYRLLRFVGGERGMTQGEIQGALSEGPRAHHRSSVHAALGLLSTAGIVGPGSTNERFLIALEYVS